MYKIYIRDANFRRAGEITDFTKLEMLPRFNAVGSFVLDLPTDSFAARELIKNKAGIIVKKDGQSFFSGTVTSRKRKWDASGDTLTLGGKDDNTYLAYRSAYPAPSGIFTQADYDVRTGPAESIMKQYVDHNCGASGLSERRSLTIEADIGLGTTVTGRARFDNLLDLLSSLALKGGGLGFKVVQVDDNLEFQVYQPTDKTRSAFFSPLLGNLASFDYSNDNPESNFVNVGGSGEGVDRIIKWNADNASIAKHGRIETFIDQRNTSDNTELFQALDEELTSKSEKNSFNFTPVDTPQLSFNKDYGLGDKVSIVITQPNEIVEKETLHYFLSFYQTGSIETERIRKIQQKLSVIQDVIREVKITIDSSGETISPVVGTEDSHLKEVPKFFDDMKKITKRLSNLERR